MFELEVGRILHILGVVLWIGGVAMVTTVILPAIKKLKTPSERVEFFELVEGKFQKQALITTLITGLSGFYMVIKLNAWARFLDVRFWWMWAMVIVWFIFTMMLFILEPLFLKKELIEKAKVDPEGTFRRIRKLHYVLLILSIITIIGAVAGSHGWFFF
ncbi:MAG: hypothetical protein PVF17_09995 [Ignavibacteria bacterium]|jgi:uncharacterized membrane protein